MMLIGILKPNTSPVYLLLHHASVYQGVRKNKCCLLVTQVTTWRHCYWTPLAYQCLCRACMCNNPLCVLAVLHACVCANCMHVMVSCPSTNLGLGYSWPFMAFEQSQGTHTDTLTHGWPIICISHSHLLSLSLLHTHTHIIVHPSPP